MKLSKKISTNKSLSNFYKKNKTMVLVSLSVCLLFLLYRFFSKNVEGFLPEPENNDSIFVSIASYRDEECPKSILNLYKKAKNPHKIYVGICQQNDDNDTDCLGKLLKTYDNVIPTKNVSIIRIPHTAAMGPTYARYMCSTLWNKQTFYFQIDSHTQFVQNWDDICIQSVLKGEKKLPNDSDLNGEVVLSYFPKANYNKTETIASNIDDTLPYTCRSDVRDNGITMGGALETSHFKKFPLIIKSVAGGMIFLRSGFLKKIPYDPWLNYVFEGEEMLLSARLWTHGYTIIAPMKNVCFHLYNDNNREGRGYNKRTLVWDDNKGEIVDSLKKGGESRLRYLLGIIPLNEVPIDFRLNIDKYGMGKKRTLEDYYAFLGVDTKKKTATNHCKHRYSLQTKKWEEI